MVISYLLIILWNNCWDVAPIHCNFFRQSCEKAQPLEGYVTMCVLRIITNIKTKKWWPSWQKNLNGLMVIGGTFIDSFIPRNYFTFFYLFNNLCA